MNYEQFTPTINGQTKNIFLVDMSKELDYHFSQLTQQWIHKYLKQNKRILIIWNKKWYNSGIICHDCGHIPQCHNCSVSINYHKDIHGDSFGLCHICKTQYQLPTSCKKCHKTNIKAYGMGIQQIAQRCKQEYNKDAYIIDSNTVNSPNKIKKVQDNIQTQQIIIGTSILTAPLQSRKPDLIIILAADHGLHIPDYTATENNFYHIHDTIHHHQTSNFIVQTFNPEEPSIRFACADKKDAFEQNNNEFKKAHRYPPFGEIVVISYKNEIESRLHNKVDTVYKELLYLQQKYQTENMEIYTTPPLVYKMFGKYRYNIVIKGMAIRWFIDIVYSKLKLAQKWFKLDRQAAGIL